MRHIRLVLASALAFALALAPASSALALLDLAPVAASDVAVETGADLSGDGRARLTSAAATLAATGTPTKFVVLRATPADPQGYARSLRQRLAYPGSILVLSPRNLAIASPLPSGAVQGAFEAERATLADDAAAGTIAVANRLSAALASDAAPGSASAAAPSDDAGVGGGVLLGLLLGGAGVVGAAVLVARRGARRRAAQSLAARRDSLDPLVDALAAQISDLHDDMAVPGARTSAAEPHHATAVLSYGEAREILEGPTPTAQGLDAAAAALETGLRAARRTRAVLEGRPPEAADEEPLLEGMCAFDPKHGRATTTGAVSTPGGETARLPVCARCAEDLEGGHQPRFREVRERGVAVPYWDSRGLGGGMGPLVGGALAGAVLGGAFDADAGAAAPSDGGWSDSDPGDPGGFGGGDFGGGFGGGGDFGGGGGGGF